VTRAVWYLCDTETMARTGGVTPPDQSSYISVLTVPLSDVGNARDLQGALEELSGRLADSRILPELFGLPSEFPAAQAVAWASAVAYGLDLPEHFGVRYADGDPEGRSVAARNMAVAGVVPLIAGPQNVAGFHLALRTEQLFAVRNSPLDLRSSVQVAAATGPGTLSVYVDGAGAGAVGMTALGIFIVYVALPAARGAGSGLETVAKEWALRLRPRQRPGETPPDRPYPATIRFPDVADRPADQ
jgi:hypothetical protein